jgi:chromosomal replication initiator protein
LDSLTNFWHAFLDGLRQKIDPIHFEGYFAPSKLHGFHGDTLVIMVPNNYIKGRICDAFMDQIYDTINELTGKDLEIVVLSESDAQADEPAKQFEMPTPVPFIGRLNQKYSFESFIVGKSNEFAHAVARAVAKNPGQEYNPLFLYGGVGLGKTHLMQAIGHYVLGNPETKGLKVMYLPAAEFTTEFVNAIREGRDRASAFREKYRQADVLLLDDIQFLREKERTQEEFFHTFNELHQSGKQIVITSDCPPAKLDHMEDRLVNRFEMGLVADIQKPDLELRMAILKKEARQKQLNVPDSVIEYIASNISSNIRQLEGAFVRVVANAALTGCSMITVDYVKEVLKDLMIESQKVITDNLIKKVVCEEFGVSVRDLVSKQRKRSLSHPRQLAMYLCRTLTDMSLAAVGESFGGKDHSTIIYAENKIKETIEKDGTFRSMVDVLIRKIKT